MGGDLKRDKYFIFLHVRIHLLEIKNAVGQILTSEKSLVAATETNKVMIVFTV